MFLVDLKLLSDHNLNINEFLALANIYIDLACDVDILKYKENLQSKGYIKILENQSIIVREKTIKLFKVLQSVELNIKTKPEKKVVKTDLALKYEINDFIEEYRNKWKGLKPGAMGSLQSCKEKMFRWCKENPQYTSAQILKAADIYLKSINNLTYLQRADYFIYKQIGKDEHSGLSTFIDEVDFYETEDWISKIV